MAVIKRGTIKSYDAATHKATVQVAGSLGVWLEGLRVATNIPAADVVAGRECSLLFLDPSNQDEAVVITIQGALPSGGGGGHTAFTQHTDTPAFYTGAALQYVRVNATETALEFHDLLAAANAWSALQTFNAGLRLPAGQQIQDGGGTGRILLSTTLPNIAFTGSAKLGSHASIDCNPQTSPDTKLRISPAATGVTEWRGLDIVPSLTTTGNSAGGTGIVGTCTFNHPASTTGHNVYGLNFVAAAYALGSGVNVASLIGARAAAQPITVTGTWTISNLYGFATDFPTNAFGGTLTINEAAMIYVAGKTQNSPEITVTTLNGLRIEDFGGTTFPTVRLMEIGPATPYLRLIGRAAPGANQTNLYLNEGGTLRRVQWKDGASVAAGDRVMVLV